MKREVAIAGLNGQSDELRRLGARSLYLFGSTAAGKAHNASDVDVFIDPVPGFSLIDLHHMRVFIRRILKRNVDLVTRDSLHPRLKSSIIKSAIKVF